MGAEPRDLRTAVPQWSNCQGAKAWYRVGERSLRLPETEEKCEISVQFLFL